MSRPLLALASFVVVPVALAQEKAPAPKRVLVYTVSAGFEHDVVKRAKPDEPSLVERALVDRAKERGWFECVLSRDAADFTKEKLGTFDLVFFYTTGELPFSAEQKRALFDFVKDGKAFAGAHCATDTFYAEPEYGAMIGAYFDGHPWHEKVRVLVDDREHPSTKHLGGAFEITDEIYQFKAPYDRSKLHVLLHLDPSTTDLARDGVHRTDRDFANAWCKDFGKGRVFYTALGHRPEVWKDERFLRHLEGGLAWAMRATLPAFDETKKDDARPDAPKPKEKTKGRLSVAPGFAADLVAEAPEILWPSAVLCLDDGSLLVGEDRCDMPGPAGEAVDRLIALHFRDDGTFTKTVFAKDLHAVMGLELVDGDVFVMNMPNLTRLRDRDGDGVADERTEVLTDLGPVPPGWPEGFNDHAVTGIRLGIDGFLYVAVGDKGVPHAHGTDGSELTLRGGGVVRVRPDGSRLEVVATGLRNVLDVAIDERGEMFTYDNTDDGLGWWTRLTHVVAGGYYGYPYDYHDHPERMLPCMAEYGGGSPCGGLVYREAAWPEELRGSLFFCEWGKGQLRRFVVRPKGATFEVAQAEDFVTAGDVRPFKPFDVCESPDGRFLYVSDWAFDGWTQSNEVGRVWRIRRADDDARRPSVARPLPTDAKELGALLSSPSWRERLGAQRALARLGTAGLDVTVPIANASKASIAQLHAIWAVAEGWNHAEPWELDPRTQEHAPAVWTQLCRAEIARPDRVRVDLGGLLIGDSMSDVYMIPEVLRAWADRVARERPSDDTTRIRNVALATARGMGRDEWATKRALAAFRRAGQIPPDIGVDDRHRAEALASLRDRFEFPVLDELRRLLDAGANGSQRALVVETLASNARREAPWDGKWWGIQPAKMPRPARTVDWDGTGIVLDVLVRALAGQEADVRIAALAALRDLDDRNALIFVRGVAELDRDETVRTFALDVLGAMKDADAADVLESVVRSRSSSESVRAHAVDAACAIRSKAMLALLRGIAGDRKAPEAQCIACIEALARIRDVETVPLVADRARSGTDAVRSVALTALARLRGKEAGAAIAEHLSDGSSTVRIAACRALGEARDARQIEALLPLAAERETATEATLALAKMPDARALAAFLAGVDSSEKRVVDASWRALLAVRDSTRGELERLCVAGKLGDKQLEAVQHAMLAPRPIVEWRVLGPFDRDGTRPTVRERDKGATDARSIDAASPDLAARFTAHDGVDATWTPIRADARTGFFDLREHWQGFDQVVAFACATIESTTKRKAELLAGSDDALRVWVNGVRVHDFTGDRAWKEDEDRFEAELVPGANTILVMVANSGGGWSFDVKVAGEASGPLFERKAMAPNLEQYRAFAIEHPGDATKGYALFRQPSGPMCIRCHTVFGEGAQVGPDLSDVAAKYGREEVLTSVLTPSQRIAEGYNAITFELANGDFVFGQVKKETKDTVEVFDTNGELKRLDSADIASRRASKTSVMPDGLASLMSKEQFADLVAYLLTLRGAPK